MTTTEYRKTSPSNASATNLSQRDSTVEETTQGDSETGTFFTHGQPNLSKAPRVTPNNILAMQRTIGNQAVQRLIQQQKARATGSAALSRQFQAVMTLQANPANGPQLPSHSSTPAASVSKINSIQRLPTSVDMKKSADDKAKGKTFVALLKLVDEYHKSISNSIVKTTPGERQAQATNLTQMYDNIDSTAKAYLEKHANSKSDILGTARSKTIATVEKLRFQVELEKSDLSSVVNNKAYNGNIKHNPTWHAALTDAGYSMEFGANKNAKIINDVQELGLPIAYASTLDKVVLTLISRANKAMGEGKLGIADQALADMKGRLPAGTFGLIKSTLMFKHIGQINPQLHAVLNNPAYKQTSNSEMADKGHQKAGGEGSVADFEFSLNVYKKNHANPHSDDSNSEYKKLSDRDNVPVDKVKSTWMKRLKWEKENVKVEDFANLGKHEKSALSKYTGNYKDLNVPLRGNLAPTTEAEQPGDVPDPDAGNGRTKRNPDAKFDTANLAITQNLLSALNKLPPYKGLVYRHDADYPGFRELNQVGAVVTEFVFASTTREAKSLKQVANSGLPEVLQVMQSKSGRFIKPGSNFNTISEDENEVLFKPGTRFKVTKRVAANINGNQKTWPQDMDPELKKALDQDREKHQVKIVLKKEED
jgi:hypothetical protein